MNSIGQSIFPNKVHIISINIIIFNHKYCYEKFGIYERSFQTLSDMGNLYILATLMNAPDGRVSTGAGLVLLQEMEQRNVKDITESPNGTQQSSAKAFF